MKSFRICLIFFLMLITLGTLFSCTSSVSSEHVLFSVDDLNGAPSTLSDDCVHTRAGGGQYHMLPQQLKDYVGATELQNWYNTFTTSAPMGSDEFEAVFCSMNISSFLKHFNIPKDVAEVVLKYNEYYSWDHDIEILYTNDKAKIDAYYTSGNDRAVELDYRYSEGFLKSKLVNSNLAKINRQEYNIWCETKLQVIKSPMIVTDLVTWSIPEFIYKFNIERDVFIKILDEWSNSFKPNHTYDLDTIYNKKEEMLEKINKVTKIEDNISIDISLRIQK